MEILIQDLKDIIEGANLRKIHSFDIFSAILNAAIALLVLNSKGRHKEYILDYIEIAFEELRKNEKFKKYLDNEHEEEKMD